MFDSSKALSMSFVLIGLVCMPIKAYAQDSKAVGFSAEVEQEIRQGYILNAATAQLHRQWTYYENPETPASQILSTLNDDVIITTPAGTTNSAAEFAAALEKSERRFENGHDLQSVSVSVGDGNTIRMMATANYVIPGEDGQSTARKVSYSASLGSLPLNDLPLFDSMDVTIGEAVDVPSLEDAYAHNRMRSLVNYYNSLVENPARDPEPFKAVFASEFELDFGAASTISTFEQFEQWLAGPASSVAASKHVIDRFKLVKREGSDYYLEIDFSWRGILANGVGLAGKTRHQWLVEDDPTEAFARIKSVAVSFLEPIAPVK